MIQIFAIVILLILLAVVALCLIDAKKELQFIKELRHKAGNEIDLISKELSLVYRSSGRLERENDLLKSRIRDIQFCISDALEEKESE